MPAEADEDTLGSCREAQPEAAARPWWPTAKRSSLTRAGGISGPDRLSGAAGKPGRRRCPGVDGGLAEPDVPGGTGALDEPGGTQFDTANLAADDRHQSGAGGAADDDLFRADHGRARTAAAGAGHAKSSAEPGHHLDRAVHDAAADVAGLEAGLRHVRSSPTRTGRSAWRKPGPKASSRCANS